MSMDVRGGRGVPHLRVRRAPRYRVHRSEEHTSELQSQSNLVCRLLLEKKKIIYSVFQPWIDRRNLAINGSLLMNLTIFWPCSIGLGRSRSRRRPELLVSDALLALAFT